MVEALHTLWRPRDFSEVRGHGAQIKSLTRILEKGTSQAFIFTGPSGVGKTTLARIIAAMVGCEPQNITAVDAATHSGADSMRGLCETVRYKAFGDKPGKATIIDECHGLSKQAWDSLLNALEEPPKHAFWFLCTTDPRKVPATAKTRCTLVNLKPLGDNEVRSLLKEVVDAEKMALDAGIIDLITHEAHGSARQALTFLAACEGVKTRKEAAEVMEAAVETDPVLELCRFLMRPGSWSKAQAMLAKLETAKQQPESVRIIVCRYMGSVLKNAKSDRDAINVLNILDHFAVPYNQAEGMAPLWLSVGRVLFAPK